MSFKWACICVKWERAAHHLMCWHFCKLCYFRLMRFSFFPLFVQWLPYTCRRMMRKKNHRANFFVTRVHWNRQIVAHSLIIYRPRTPKHRWIKSFFDLLVKLFLDKKKERVTCSLYLNWMHWWLTWLVSGNRDISVCALWVWVNWKSAKKKKYGINQKYWGGQIGIFKVL